MYYLTDPYQEPEVSASERFALYRLHTQSLLSHTRRYSAYCFAEIISWQRWRRCMHRAQANKLNHRILDILRHRSFKTLPTGQHPGSACFKPALCEPVQSNSVAVPRLCPAIPAYFFSLILYCLCWQCMQSCALVPHSSAPLRSSGAPSCTTETNYGVLLRMNCFTQCTRTERTQFVYSKPGLITQL